MIDLLKRLFHWGGDELVLEYRADPQPPTKYVYSATVIGPIISARANQHGLSIVVDGEVPEDLQYSMCSPPCVHLLLLSYARRKGICVELVTGGIVSKSTRTIKGRKVTFAKLHISERFEGPIRVEV